MIQTCTHGVSDATCRVSQDNLVLVVCKRCCLIADWWIGSRIRNGSTTRRFSCKTSLQRTSVPSIWSTRLSLVQHISLSSSSQPSTLRTSPITQRSRACDTEWQRSSDLEIGPGKYSLTGRPTRLTCKVRGLSLQINVTCYHASVAIEANIAGARTSEQDISIERLSFSEH